MHQLRLHCSLFYVDVRLREFNGRRRRRRPAGLALGVGMTPAAGRWTAVEPFDGVPMA